MELPHKKKDAPCKDFYAAIYSDLVDYCREVKVRLIHKKGKYTEHTDAYYRNDVIIMNPTLRNTERGVCVLAHEIGHFFQEKDGEFDDILLAETIKGKIPKYSDDLLNRVIDRKSVCRERV